MRAITIVCGVFFALVLWAFGQLFGINGPNWDWWQGACRVGALVVLGASVWIAFRSGPRGEPRRADAAAILGGCAGIVVSAVIAGRWFNDSYSGSQVWPHLLAVAALAGFLAAVVGAARALT